MLRVETQRTSEQRAQRTTQLEHGLPSNQGYV